MAEQEYNSLERINIIRGILDKLVDAKGREKCGYITVIDDFLNHIQEDILILEEKVRDAEQKELQKKDIQIFADGEPIDQNGIE